MPVNQGRGIHDPATNPSFGPGNQSCGCNGGELELPPLIMLDEDFRVIGASLSFCRPFGLDCAVLTGSSILEMGNGE